MNAASFSAQQLTQTDQLMTRKKAKPAKLFSEVDWLTAEMAQMKSPLLSLHPGAGAFAGSSTPSMPELVPEKDFCLWICRRFRRRLHGPCQSHGMGLPAV